MFTLPHSAQACQANRSPIYEDLLVRIKPIRKTRPNEVNRPVSFLSVQDMVTELIISLGIQSARFDPWQTIQLRETLHASGRGDVDEISFSNPDQYKRARLAETLLYGGLLSFLPDETRDREWRRLQLINGATPTPRSVASSGGVSLSPGAKS